MEAVEVRHCSCQDQIIIYSEDQTIIMKAPSLGQLTHTLMVATMAMAEVRFKDHAAKLLKVGHTRCSQYHQ